MTGKEIGRFFTVRELRKELSRRGRHAHRGNMACRSENHMQEDKQVDDRMEVVKMRLRKFDSIERVRKELRSRVSDCEQKKVNCWNTLT